MILDAREHTMWGDAINWMDWPSRKIVGWLTPRPNIDDEVIFKMGSGLLAKFKIIKIEYIQDPPDLFFATLSDIGYIE